MTRTRLTIKDVLNNPKYRNILYLLAASEKSLQFIHLRYALCKKHGINLSQYPKGKIEKPIENILKELKEYTKDFESTKFNSYQSLGNALTRLKKLGIVDTKKDKKKYPYYFLTPDGLYHETLRSIHWYINNTFPNDVTISKDINKDKLFKDLLPFKRNVIKELNKILFKRIKKE